MENKIKFKDLSVALKTIVVISWVVAASYVAAFIVGFVAGVLKVL